MRSLVGNQTNEYLYEFKSFKHIRLTFNWNQTFPQKIKQLVKTQLTASHLTITFTRSDAGERKFYLQSWSTLDSKLIEQKIRRHKNLESRCWAKTDHLIPSLLRDEAAQNKNWIMLFMDKWISKREKRHFYLWFHLKSLRSQQL